MKSGLYISFRYIAFRFISFDNVWIAYCHLSSGKSFINMNFPFIDHIVNAICIYICVSWTHLHIHTSTLYINSTHTFTKMELISMVLQQQSKLNKQSISFPFINKYVRTNSGSCMHIKQIEHKFRNGMKWKTNFKYRNA